jgi:uncharacterized membrane protein YgaE (UPF0421/DUF939 family)
MNILFFILFFPISLNSTYSNILQEKDEEKKLSLILNYLRDLQNIVEPQDWEEIKNFEMEIKKDHQEIKNLSKYRSTELFYRKKADIKKKEDKILMEILNIIEKNFSGFYHNYKILDKIKTNKYHYNKEEIEKIKKILDILHKYYDLNSAESILSYDKKLKLDLDNIDLYIGDLKILKSSFRLFLKKIKNDKNNKRNLLQNLFYFMMEKIKGN